LSKNTITDLKELERELASIRKKGFSLSDSEVDLGAAALAVPIFDHKGLVIASLSLIGLKEAIFREDQQELLDIMKESARGISAELGYVER
jgi:DNA-binding IclR family transcriptional regulator